MLLLLQDLLKLPGLCCKQHDANGSLQPDMQGWGSSVGVEKGSRGWNMATIQGVTLRSTAARSEVIQAIWVAEMSMLVEV